MVGGGEGTEGRSSEERENRSDSGRGGEGGCEGKLSTEPGWEGGKAREGVAEMKPEDWEEAREGVTGAWEGGVQ